MPGLSPWSIRRTRGFLFDPHPLTKMPLFGICACSLAVDRQPRAYPMKVLSSLVMISFVVIGCAITPVPQAPNVQTEKGRNCVRKCQQQHSSCTSEYENVKGMRHSWCISQCNQKLGDCYDQCFDEPIWLPDIIYQGELQTQSREMP